MIVLEGINDIGWPKARLPNGTSMKEAPFAVYW